MQLTVAFHFLPHAEEVFLLPKLTHTNMSKSQPHYRTSPLELLHSHQLPFSVFMTFESI